MYSEKWDQFKSEPKQAYAVCSCCGEECIDTPYTDEDAFCCIECENEYHITESY